MPQSLRTACPSLIKQAPVEKLMYLPPLLPSNQHLQLLLPQIAHISHIPHLQRYATEILLRDPRHRPQHILRRLVEALIIRLLARHQTDLHSLDGVRLFLLLLQLLEDLSSLVGRGRPDDLKARKSKREQRDLRLQIRRIIRFEGRGRMVGAEGVEGEGFVLVEFYEEQGVLVVLEHGFGLVEEAAGLEGGDEVFDGFALDADLRREHVVAYREHAGDDDVGAAVEEGGEGGAEFANVDDDAGGLCCRGEAATACDAGVDCAEERFLRVFCRSVVGDNNGHVLDGV